MRPLPHTTPDRALEGIERLRALFPEAVTESDKGPAVDFDLLRQRLSPALVEGPAERYRLEWPGKRAAIHEANAPTAATLRPVRERSKAFDSTQNLYIEGDNLEALKLLRQSYAGQVKMIYIDPPYNTGHDFVYNDAFARSKEAELAAAGRLDEDGRRTIAAAALKENGEANGRFHSDWLSMMWPRLQLAKDLLAQDGVLFISIDDHEVHNLRKLCDEIFGEQNFVAQYKWNKTATPPALSQKVRGKFEYILCYERMRTDIEYNGGIVEGGDMPLLNEGNSIRTLLFPKETVYLNFYEPLPPGAYDKVKLLDELKIKMFPTSVTNTEAFRLSGAFKWTQETLNAELEKGTKFLIKTKRCAIRYARQGTRIKRPSDLISSVECGVGTNEAGAKDVACLFGTNIMSYPKPVSLIKYLLPFAENGKKDSLVLDFFSGSATTAHAVMALNAEDGGNRRFILVQLPEATAEDSEARKAGYATICDIGEERIRRAGAELLAKHPELEGKLDVGFRVLRVDAANLENVRVTPAAFAEAVREQGVLALGTETEQGRLALVALEDTVKKGRGEEDLLFQVMREVGLPLTCPVASRAVGGVTVWEAAGGLLSVCFAARGITEAVAEAMAEAEPKWAVFREAGFANDSVKANVGQVFKRLSPATDLRTL